MKSLLALFVSNAFPFSLLPSIPVATGYLQKQFCVWLLLCTGAYHVYAQAELVSDFYPGYRSSSPSELTRFNNTLYFSANSPLSGRELWYYNAHTGINLLKEILPGAGFDGSSFPHRLTAGAQYLYFGADIEPEQGLLWGSEGSNGYTLPLETEALFDVFFLEILPHSQATYFIKQDDSYYYLGSSDGTLGGDKLIDQVDNVGYIEALTLFQDQLYYLKAEDPSEAPQLWRYNPSTSHAEVAFSESCSELLVLGDFLFYFQQSASGAALWRSNGSTQELVSQVSTQSEVAISDFTLAGELLYFAVKEEAKSAHLWVSDGSQVGTQALKSFKLDASLAHTQEPLTQFTGVDSSLFFIRAVTSNYSQQRYVAELWVSQGTKSTTRKLTSFTHAQGSGAFRSLRAVDQRLFFDGADLAHGTEIWVSDGSSAGTQLVQDLAPGERSSVPSNFTLLDKSLYFAATDPLRGRELWKLPLAALTHPSQARIESFQLIDVSTQQTLGPIQSGDTLYLNTSSQLLNIEAKGIVPTDGSVIFYLNGEKARVENIAPYALAGDAPAGKFRPWDLSPGDYTLKAVPYTQQGGKGEKGQSLSITFHLSQAPVISHFMLVDSKKDLFLRPLNDGDTIDLAMYGKQLNIVASPLPEQVGSVSFVVNGKRVRIENIMPYALGGDDNGNYFNHWKPSPGVYTLTATPHSHKQGKGKAGKALQISFSIIDTKSRAQVTPAGFKLYPNPSQSHLTVTLPEPPTQLLRLSLYDDQGHPQKTFVLAQQQTTLFVGDLPPGHYILKIQGQALESIHQVLIRP